MAKDSTSPCHCPPTLPVAVVIPTWNSARSMDACLASVQAQGVAEVVAVDNGSADGTLAGIGARFPAVTTIALPRNLGFAAACNVGIRSTKAPYVLILNDDAVLDASYVQRLLAALVRCAEAASATGKLTYQERGIRRIDSTGIVMRWCALSPLDRGHGTPDRQQYDTPGRVFGPSGAAALFRRAALNDVGPPYFDEDLFAYYEDVDLAWRLSRRGWVHLYVPSATGSHRRRGPTGKPPGIAAQAFANRYLVWLKNESLARFACYGPLAVAWESARVLRRLAFADLSVLRAMTTAAALAPRFLAKRRLARRRSTAPRPRPQAVTDL